MEPLVTAERLAVHLRRRDLLEDVDATESLEQAVELASGVVRNHVGWPLTVTTQTELRTGDGSPVLLLPTLRLSTATVVDAATGGAVTGFDIYSAGILSRAARWTGRYTITYVHGYADADLPREIIAVVLAVAARAFVNPEALVRDQVGPASPSFTQVGPNQAGGYALLGVEQAVLDRHSLR